MLMCDILRNIYIYMFFFFLTNLMGALLIFGQRGVIIKGLEEITVHNKAVSTNGEGRKTRLHYMVWLPTY